MKVGRGGEHHSKLSAEGQDHLKVDDLEESDHKSEHDVLPHEAQQFNVLSPLADTDQKAQYYHEYGEQG